MTRLGKVRILQNAWVTSESSKNITTKFSWNSRARRPGHKIGLQCVQKARRRQNHTFSSSNAKKLYWSYSWFALYVHKLLASEAKAKALCVQRHVRRQHHKFSSSLQRTHIFSYSYFALYTNCQHWGKVRAKKKSRRHSSHCWGKDRVGQGEKHQLKGSNEVENSPWRQDGRKEEDLMRL